MKYPKENQDNNEIPNIINLLEHILITKTKYK